MGKIIALQGRANSGKTTTINMLPAILIANGYVAVAGKHQSHGGDFLDIYENGKQRVGVTSSGDTYDLVKDRLTDLVNEKCDVCICACRTSDRIPPGTIAAVNSFSGYVPIFIRKTIAASPTHELIVNSADANTIFLSI